MYPAMGIDIRTSDDDLHFLNIAQHLARAYVDEQGGSVWASASFRVALNLYCRRMTEESNPERANFVSFLSLIERPIVEWGFAEVDGWFQSEDYLILNGEPTQLAFEMCGNGSDLSGNWSERWMGECLDWCRLHAKQEVYELVRVAIINHPVVDVRTFVDLVNNPDFEDLGTRFRDAYEDVPPECVFDGSVYCCGYCGWTLSKVGGEFRCHSAICQSRSGSSRACKELPYRSGMQRLKIGLARYVAAPGRAEMDLYQWLKREKLNPHLYPQIDAYDVGISLNGKHIAIDVKDWANPFLLSKALSRSTPSGCDEFLIVVPDDRCKMVRGYTRIVERQSSLSCYSISHFKRHVRRLLEVSKP